MEKTPIHLIDIQDMYDLGIYAHQLPNPHMKVINSQTARAVVTTTRNSLNALYRFIDVASAHVLFPLRRSDNLAIVP